MGDDERFEEETRIEAQEEELEQEAPEAPGGGDYAPSVAARVSAFQRAGGAVIPIVTTVFALLMGDARGRRDRPQPVDRVQGHLRRHRPELAVPVGSGPGAHGRRVQPAADADRDDLADPGRLRRLVRLQVRHVQHRRQRPVHHGRARLGLDRLLLGQHEREPAHLPGDHARDGRRGAVGRRSRAS